MDDLFSQDGQSSVQTKPSPQPLAESLRPQTLDEFIGQQHIMAADKVLPALLKQPVLPSLILWGPPGSGKTSLARLIAKQSNAAFYELSAVSASTTDIKKIVEEARQRRRISQRHTLLFLDEIHRFNKAQQDVLLPHVESGVFSLIGATTENPSFSLNSALLSRSQVIILQLLTDEELNTILQRAQAYLASQDKTLALSDKARSALLQYADGDARRLLGAVEAIVALFPQADASLSVEQLRTALQQKHLHYDKQGEEHYNLISALHKSLRDSDPHASIYWLSRMLQAGEDPMYLARRLTRAAAEDIGLADPQALVIATAAMDATKQIGMPEAEVILAEAAAYLSLAPKSNAVYQAINQVHQDLQTTSNQPVPLHLRNAPTALMKDSGYGKGYQYAHDQPDAKVDQQHLPDAIKHKQYFKPQRGWEKQVDSHYLKKLDETSKL